MFDNCNENKEKTFLPGMHASYHFLTLTGAFRPFFGTSRYGPTLLPPKPPNFVYLSILLLLFHNFCYKMNSR